jgi:hypothetical protein
VRRGHLEQQQPGPTANDKLVHRYAKLASRMQQHGICVVCGDSVFVD